MHGGDAPRLQILPDMLKIRSDIVIKDASEEQRLKLGRYFQDMKSLDDIVVRAKGILKKTCESGEELLTDFCENAFMHTVFSYHPNHDRDITGQIRVGTYLGHHTFFINGSQVQEMTEKDAISLKKCMIEISQAFTFSMR